MRYQANEKTKRSKGAPRRQKWLLNGVVYPNRAALIAALKERAGQ